MGHKNSVPAAYGCLTFTTAIKPQGHGGHADSLRACFRGSRVRSGVPHV